MNHPRRLAFVAPILFLMLLAIPRKARPESFTITDLGTLSTESSYAFDLSLSLRAFGKIDRYRSKNLKQIRTPQP
jgi:hypothetical protein